jgi:hypothetical protein
MCKHAAVEDATANSLYVISLAYSGSTTIYARTVVIY